MAGMSSAPAQSQSKRPFFVGNLRMVSSKNWSCSSTSLMKTERKVGEHKRV